jgi:hypothetical protein
MARSIAGINDEARFYEERANPWLRNMLLERGAAGFRSFQERFPEITYVTYEPRQGHQLAEWITLVLATVDIVVVDSAVSSDIRRWIGELTRPQLHTFLVNPEGNLSLSREVAEEMNLYRGICVNRAGDEPVELLPSQYLISFGPAMPEPGQNGSPQRHVETTAENLVQQIVHAVDETMTGGLSGPHPDNEYPG